MIKNSVGCFAALVLFCAAGTTHAAPITWGPDIYDPADVYFAGGGAACTALVVSPACETLAYVHDLTAYGFVPGASSGDQITGGLLEILFRDDETDAPSEGFKITLENILQPGTLNAGSAFSFAGISGSLLASLQDDGILHIIVARQNGDFVFDRSTFTANGTRASDDEENTSSPAVPEPTSLSLLASGALGLMLRARRRTSGTR